MRVAFVAVAHCRSGIPADYLTIDGPDRDTYEEAMNDLPTVLAKANQLDNHTVSRTVYGEIQKRFYLE